MTEIDTKPQPEGDIATKQLLLFKIIDALILKLCCPEFAALSLDEIVECIEQPIAFMSEPVDPQYVSSRVRGENTEALEDGNKIVYDSLFTVVCNGERIRINIEVQAGRNLGYDIENRIVFYLGRGITIQKSRGIIRGTDYNNLQKVYSIWLFIDPLKSMESVLERGEFQTSCQHLPDGPVVSTQSPASRKLQYAKLHLPKGNMQATDKDPLNILGVLFRNRGVPGKKQFLEKNGIFVDTSLEEALKSMYTIEDSIRDEAREEFQKETARNMLARGFTLELVEQITGLTQQVIEKLKQELMPPPSTTVQSAHLQPA